MDGFVTIACLVVVRLPICLTGVGLMRPVGLSIVLEPAGALVVVVLVGELDLLGIPLLMVVAGGFRCELVVLT